MKKACVFCGQDIPLTSTRCVFCGKPQPASPSSSEPAQHTQLGVVAVPVEAPETQRRAPITPASRSQAPFSFSGEEPPEESPTGTLLGIRPIPSPPKAIAATTLPLTPSVTRPPEATSEPKVVSEPKVKPEPDSATRRGVPLASPQANKLPSYSTAPEGSTFPLMPVAPRASTAVSSGSAVSTLPMVSAVRRPLPGESPAEGAHSPAPVPPESFQEAPRASTRIPVVSVGGSARIPKAEPSPRPLGSGPHVQPAPAHNPPDPLQALAKRPTAPPPMPEAPPELPKTESPSGTLGSPLVPLVETENAAGSRAYSTSQSKLSAVFREEDQDDEVTNNGLGPSLSMGGDEPQYLLERTLNEDEEEELAAENAAANTAPPFANVSGIVSPPSPIKASNRAQKNAIKSTLPGFLGPQGFAIGAPGSPDYVESPVEALMNYRAARPFPQEAAKDEPAPQVPRPAGAEKALGAPAPEPTSTAPQAAPVAKAEKATPQAAPLPHHEAGPVASLPDTVQESRSQPPAKPAEKAPAAPPLAGRPPLDVPLDVEVGSNTAQLIHAAKDAPQEATPETLPGARMARGFGLVAGLCLLFAGLLPAGPSPYRMAWDFSGGSMALLGSWLIGGLAALSAALAPLRPKPRAGLYLVAVVPALVLAVLFGVSLLSDLLGPAIASTAEGVAPAVNRARGAGIEKAAALYQDLSDSAPGWRIALLLLGWTLFPAALLYRRADTSSRLARVLVVLGSAVVLVNYLVPAEGKLLVALLTPVTGNAEAAARAFGEGPFVGASFVWSLLAEGDGVSAFFGLILAIPALLALLSFTALLPGEQAERLPNGSLRVQRPPLAQGMAGVWGLLFLLYLPAPLIALGAFLCLDPGTSAVGLVLVRFGFATAAMPLLFALGAGQLLTATTYRRGL